MSELKVYYHYANAWHNECTEFYIKSEADNVIAELEKKLDIYKRGWMENDKVNANQYAEIRHHKYKRCLANANVCAEKLYRQNLTTYGYEFYCKWLRRWLAIAEKFKPNSTINKKGGTNALQR